MGSHLSLGSLLDPSIKGNVENCPYSGSILIIWALQQLHPSPSYGYLQWTEFREQYGFKMGLGCLGFWVFIGFWVLLGLD